MEEKFLAPEKKKSLSKDEQSPEKLLLGIKLDPKDISTIRGLNEKNYGKYQLMIFSTSDPNESIEVSCDDLSLKPFGVKRFDSFTYYKEIAIVLGVSNNKLMFLLANQKTNAKTIQCWPEIRNCYDILKEMTPTGNVDEDLVKKANTIKESMEDVYKFMLDICLNGDKKAIDLIFEYFDQSHSRENWQFVFDPDFSILATNPFFYLLYEKNPDIFYYVKTRYETLLKKYCSALDFPDNPSLHYQRCAYEAFKDNNIQAALLFSSDLKAENFTCFSDPVDELLKVLSNKEDLLIELLLREFFDSGSLCGKGISKVIDIYHYIMSAFENYSPTLLVTMLDHCLKNPDITLKCFYALLTSNLIEDNPDFNFEIIKRFLIDYQQIFDDDNMTFQSILKHLYTMDFSEIGNKTLFKDNTAKKEYFLTYVGEISCFEKNFEQLIKDEAKNGINKKIENEQPKSISENKIASAAQDIKVDLLNLKSKPELLRALVTLEAVLNVSNGIAIDFLLSLKNNEFYEVHQNMLEFLKYLKAISSDSILAQICYQLAIIYHSQQVQVSLPEEHARKYHSLAIENFLKATCLGHDLSLQRIISIANQELKNRESYYLIPKLFALDVKTVASLFKDLTVFEKFLLLKKEELNRKKALFLGEVYQAQEKFAEAEKYLLIAAIEGCEVSLNYLIDKPQYTKAVQIQAYIGNCFSPDKISENYFEKIFLTDASLTRLALNDFLQKEDINKAPNLFDFLYAIYTKLIFHFHIQTNHTISVINNIENLEIQTKILKGLQEDLIADWKNKEKQNVFIDIAKILAFKKIPEMVIEMAEFYVSQDDLKKQVKGLELTAALMDQEDLYFDPRINNILKSVKPDALELMYNSDFILPVLQKCLLNNYQPELDYQYRWETKEQREKEYLQTIEIIENTFNASSEKAVEIFMNAYLKWKSISRIYQRKSEFAAQSADGIIANIFNDIVTLKGCGKIDVNQACVTRAAILGEFKQINGVMEAMIKCFLKARANEDFHPDQVLEEIIEIAKKACENNKGFKIFNSDTPEVIQFYQKIASIIRPCSSEIFKLINQDKKDILVFNKMERE